MNIDIHELSKISFVFLRIGAMLFAMPFFGDSVVSTRIKIVITCSLTIGIYIAVPSNWMQKNDLTVMGYMLFALWEIILGLTIGYLSKLFLKALLWRQALLVTKWDLEQQIL